MPVIYSMSVIGAKIGFLSSMLMIYIFIGIAVFDMIAKKGILDIVTGNPVLIVLEIILFWLVSAAIIRHKILKTDLKCLEY